MTTPTIRAPELGNATRSLAALEYWVRSYRRTWRSGALTAFVMPLLFLAAFGYGLGSLVDADGHDTIDGIRYLSYLSYVAPGILAAGAVAGAFDEVTRSVRSARHGAGHYHVQAGSPLTVPDIVTGHMLFIVLRLLLGAVVFTVIGGLAGAFGSAWVVPAVVVAALTGLAHVGPLMAFAITREDDRDLSLPARSVMVPLLLFAGTVFPISALPAPVEVLAWLTPLWHGTQLCRELSMGDVSVPVALGHLAYVVVWCVGGYALAVRSYQRVLRPGGGTDRTN